LAVIGYTPGMDTALVVLAIVVALVAIDAIAKLDERPPEEPKRDPGTTTTQKIVVDLTGRDRE
jgi:hypothetical protein